MPKEEELIFCVLFCGTLFVFLLFFFLSIVINCVSFTTSDYPFMSCDIRLLITRLISIVTLFLYNIHFYQKCRECICTLCDARVIYRRNFRGKIEIFETALKTCMHSSMSAYVCAVWRAI